MRPRRPEWMRRQVCAWYGAQPLPNCTGPEGAPVFGFPEFVTGDFADVVRDHGRLYLRAATVVNSERESLRVVTSERLDRNLIEQIAKDLGKITFSPSAAKLCGARAAQQRWQFAWHEQGESEAPFSAGAVPPAVNTFDFQIPLPVPVQVVDWTTGERQRAGALARVETRPALLYARLFAALGDYAKGVEYILLSIAFVFAVIEVLALWIGTKLTRSITSSVADLYEATMHVNRGDFSHRIRGEIERSAGGAGELLQLDDGLDRAAGAGAERKTAAGK